MNIPVHIQPVEPAIAEALKPWGRGMLEVVRRQVDNHGTAIMVTQDPSGADRYCLTRAFFLWDGTKRVPQVSADLIDVTAAQVMSVLMETEFSYTSPAEDSLVAALKERGFKVIQTGGGCEALLREKNGEAFVVTDTQGCSLPSVESWLFEVTAGAYEDRPDDGTPPLSFGDSESSLVCLITYLEHHDKQGA